MGRKIRSGDVLRYSRGSKETGIQKGEYARVIGVDADAQSDHGGALDGDNRAMIHAASRACRSTARSSAHFLWATASSLLRQTMN